MMVSLKVRRAWASGMEDILCAVVPDVSRVSRGMNHERVCMGEIMNEDRADHHYEDEQMRRRINF